MELCRRCKINKIEKKNSKRGQNYCSLCNYYINKINDNTENNFEIKTKNKNKINYNLKGKSNNIDLNIVNNKHYEIKQIEHFKNPDNYNNNDNYIEEYNKNYNNKYEYKNLYLIESQKFLNKINQLISPNDPIDYSINIEYKNYKLNLPPEYNKIINSNEKKIMMILKNYKK